MKLNSIIIFGLLSIFSLWNASAIAQDTTIGYPISKKTGKITYAKTVSTSGSKAKLFKRAEQFIISQNFDRTENIRCKDKSHVLLQFVNTPITYKDLEDGKYLGNGFVNFEYRGKERFVILFKYSISVTDDMYKYQFTDFQVLEFVTAPKNKGKSSSFAMTGENKSFGRSSGFTEFSANDVRKFDLEDFIYGGAYERSGSDDVFQERITRLIGDLNEAMKDPF